MTTSISSPARKEKESLEKIHITTKEEHGKVLYVWPQKVTFADTSETSPYSMPLLALLMAKTPMTTPYVASTTTATPNNGLVAGGERWCS